MNITIGACGISCAACPAYLATMKNDDNERAKVARTWSEQYGTNLSAADINCRGCASTDEPIFGYCKICEIRKCASAKNTANCGFCDDYACEKVTQLLMMVPAAKAALDQVHENR